MYLWMYICITDTVPVAEIIPDKGFTEVLYFWTVIYRTKEEQKYLFFNDLTEVW